MLKKYEESLNMYVAVIEQINHQKIKVEQTSFLYDSIAHNSMRSAVNLRK